MDDENKLTTVETTAVETAAEAAPEKAPADETPTGGETIAPAKKTDDSGRANGGVFKNMGTKLSEGTYRTLFGLGLLLILATKAVFDFNGLKGFINNAWRFVISLLGYILIGFIIAYVLNAYVDWLSAHPLKKIKSDKKRRTVGIIIAYITLAAVLTFLIGTIVPKLVESIGNLAKVVPGMADKVYQFYIDIVENGKFDLPDVVKEGITNGINGIKDWLMGLLSSDIITGFLPRLLTATGSGIFQAMMGLLVSVYMLIEKDRAKTAATRITYGLFKKSRADNVVDGGRKIDMVFRQYFAGKLLQATVILLLSYIVLLIGGINYAILFAAIIAITNMIPYIGPWIGGIFTVLISLVQDPWMGVRALICVLIIQMLDNWFITPNVVGHKMGVSPLLVLIGLGIGGSLFGFVGVLIGDVLAAIAKVFIYDTIVERRIRKKIAAGELPPDYVKDPAADEGERKTRVGKLIDKITAKVKQFFLFLGRKIGGFFKKIFKRRKK